MITEPESEGPIDRDLQRITDAADTARGALARRDRAVLDAFAHGRGGPEIAAAAGLSVAGVYRIKERARNYDPPSRRRPAEQTP